MDNAIQMNSYTVQSYSCEDELHHERNEVGRVITGKSLSATLMFKTLDGLAPSYRSDERRSMSDTSSRRVR